MSAAILKSIVESNRAGEARGIYSICSAHPMVLEAAILQAKSDESPLLIEATCNQVNQDGGYTGMTPVDFHRYVGGIARKLEFPTDRLVLGGDHLGPNPWTSLPAEEALTRAKEMVAAYLQAGFTKIHLDASMSCAGDPFPLPDDIIAERAAALCAVAESAADPAAAPVYIIGTEVPVPGGAQEDLHELAATEVSDLEQTLATHRRLFQLLNLEQAWNRVIGVVVQPGVEFDHASVVGYEPRKASALSKAILEFDGIVYEAHSTDYQTETALSNLVRDHFAILKVGPGLTYAAREALFALSYIEQEWIKDRPRSNLREVLEKRMLEEPGNWAKYYAGTDEERTIARKYSFSDRSRYYWTDPEVEKSVALLLDNLANRPPPITLLSQFMPNQYAAVRAGLLKIDPMSLVHHRIQEIISEYARASGFSTKT